MAMICLTRLNQKVFYLNSDLIEVVEETPDTLITMTTGKKFLVAESADAVLEKIIAFRNQCFRDVHVQIRRKGEKVQFEWDRETGEAMPVRDD